MRPPTRQLPPLEALLAYAVALASLIVVAPAMYMWLGLSAMIVVQLLCIAGPAAIAAGVRSETITGAAALLGIRRARGRAMLGAVLIGSSFWYVNLQLVAPLADRYLHGRDLVRSLDQSLLAGSLPLWLIITIVSVMPALCEELLMRGGLCRALRVRLGPAGAVVLSALLFGVTHLHPAHMATTSAFGLVLGATCLATDSVLPGMLMHFLNNALVLIVGAEVIPAATWSLHTFPLMWGLICGFLCVCGGLLIWSGRQGATTPPAERPW